MNTRKVLIAQKKDKSEYKIQEYKQQDNSWIIDLDTKIYIMLEIDIIESIENGNDIFRTVNRKNLNLTSVEISNSNLISESNDNLGDNLNNLPTY